MSQRNKKIPGFRLDPRSKIFLMILISVSILTGEGITGNYICKAGLVFIPISLLFLEGHIKGAVLFGILYVAVSNSSAAFQYISETSITGVSLRLLMGLVSGMGPCMIMGYYMITSTKTSEFIAAMERLHISKNIIIPFAVMFRFFPTIKEEYEAISTAMRMRGIRFGWNLPAMLEYRLVPLMIGTVKIGNELAAAAMTRGLGSHSKRTSVCVIGFGASDVIFIMLSVAASVLYAVI